MASTKVIRTSNYFNNFPSSLKIDWLNPPQLSLEDCQMIANNLLNRPVYTRHFLAY